eukprot:768446-Hanusia_phi.AAC.2
MLLRCILSSLKFPPVPARPPTNLLLLPFRPPPSLTLAQGYLSEALAIGCGLKVLGIDASAGNTSGALKRQSLVSRLTGRRQREVDEGKAAGAETKEKGREQEGVFIPVTGRMQLEVCSSFESPSMSLSSFPAPAFLLARSPISPVLSAVLFPVQINPVQNSALYSSAMLHKSRCRQFSDLPWRQVWTRIQRETNGEDDKLMLVGLHTCGDLASTGHISCPVLPRSSPTPFLSSPGFSQMEERQRYRPPEDDDGMICARWLAADCGQVATVPCQEFGFPLSSLVREHVKRVMQEGGEVKAVLGRNVFNLAANTNQVTSILQVEERSPESSFSIASPFISFCLLVLVPHLLAASPPGSIG